MQSLTFTTCLRNYNLKMFATLENYSVSWPAGWPNTDHGTDSHFSCESKNHLQVYGKGESVRLVLPSSNATLTVVKIPQNVLPCYFQKSSMSHKICFFFVFLFLSLSLPYCWAFIRATWIHPLHSLTHSHFFAHSQEALWGWWDSKFKLTNTSVYNAIFIS